MKNFVDAVKKRGKGLKYLNEKFFNLNDGKLKECVFIGPQIHGSDLFEHLLAETEKSAWLIFRGVCLNFLGNVKADNC
jgi:hypothetical protein